LTLPVFPAMSVRRLPERLLKSENTFKASTLEKIGV
jgi:hypothetical protein